MFPLYTDSAFQTISDSLNASVTIDYINKEVKIRKDGEKQNSLNTIPLISELKITKNIHVHPNITIYLFLPSIFISVLIISLL